MFIPILPGVGKAGGAGPIDMLSGPATRSADSASHRQAQANNCYK